MQFVLFGRTGITVSRLSIGTATFGKQTDEAAARAILNKAGEAGVNFIDTANSYPIGANPSQIGLAEEIVGRWLPGNRNRLIVSTKAGDIAGPAGWDRGCSRKHLLHAIDASLRRLGTDYVPTLYQLHVDDKLTPLDESLEGILRPDRSSRAKRDMLACLTFLPIGLHAHLVAKTPSD